MALQRAIQSGLLAVLLSGCAALPQSAPLGEYLDERTGTTVVHLAEPAVYYREAPTLAAHARDYVSLAPLEISRGGRRERLLWTCYWSTIDRRDVAPAESPRLLLLVDGEPMELQRAGRTTLDDWPYQVPLNGGQRAVYVLTRNQVERLGAATELRVLVEGGVAGGEYLPWRAADPGLGEFARWVGSRELSLLARSDN